jgi:hypothetical protein
MPALLLDQRVDDGGLAAGVLLEHDAARIDSAVRSCLPPVVLYELLGDRGQRQAE